MGVNGKLHRVSTSLSSRWSRAGRNSHAALSASNGHGRSAGQRRRRDWLTQCVSCGFLLIVLVCLNAQISAAQGEEPAEDTGSPGKGSGALGKASEGSQPYGLPVEAYYSMDDTLCEPLAKTLTVLVRDEISATDLLSSVENAQFINKQNGKRRWEANKEEFGRAGFTAPEPKNKNGYLAVWDNPGMSEQDTEYELPITEDGRRWTMIFEDLSLGSHTIDSSNAWFVLKQGRSFRPTKRSTFPWVWGPEFVEPAPDDVAAQSFDPDPKRRIDPPEGLLLPLDPRFRKKRFANPDQPDSNYTVAGFTRPIQYKDGTIYMLSDQILWGRANTSFFALTRFTHDLKLQSVCLYGSSYDLT